MSYLSVGKLFLFVSMSGPASASSNWQFWNLSDFVVTKHWNSWQIKTPQNVSEVPSATEPSSNRSRPSELSSEAVLESEKDTATRHHSCHGDPHAEKMEGLETFERRTRLPILFCSAMNFDEFKWSQRLASHFLRAMQSLQSSWAILLRKDVHTLPSQPLSALLAPQVIRGLSHGDWSRNKVSTSFNSNFWLAIDLSVSSHETWRLMSSLFVKHMNITNIANILTYSHTNPRSRAKKNAMCPYRL